MSTLEEKVDKNFEGRKIREFLKEKMGLSSRLIKGASIDKRILVNNNPVKMNYVLKENDEIVINLAKKESQNIIYHGVVTNDEMMKIQAKSDLLVCPRHFDEFTTKYTFPSKLLEYIIAGVPVLSNKLKGIPQEYEKYVTLSEYDDPLTWAKYINEILIDNPEKYKQKAIWALKESAEKKSWENQAKKVISLFNQVGENND